MSSKEQGDSKKVVFDGLQSSIALLQRELQVIAEDFEGKVAESRRQAEDAEAARIAAEEAFARVHYEFSSFRNGHEQAIEKVGFLEEKSKSLEDRTRSFEEKTRELELQLTAKEQELNELEESEFQKNLRIRELEASYQQATEEIGAVRNAFQAAKDKISQIVTVFRAREKKYRQLFNAYKDIGSTLKEREQVILTLQNELKAKSETTAVSADAFVSEKRHLENAIAAAQERAGEAVRLLSQKDAEQKRLAGSYRELEAKFSELKTALDKEVAAAAQLFLDKQNLSNEAEKLRYKIEILSGENKSLSMQLQASVQAYTISQKQLDAAGRESQRYSAEARIHQENNVMLKKINDELKQDSAEKSRVAENLRGDLECARQLTQESENKAAEWKDKWVSSRLENEKFGTEISKMNQALEEQRNLLAEAKQEQAQTQQLVQAEAGKAAAQIEKAKSEVEKLEDKFASDLQTLELKHQQETAEYKMTIQAVQNEVHTLRHVIASYESRSLAEETAADAKLQAVIAREKQLKTYSMALANEKENLKAQSDLLAKELVALKSLNPLVDYLELTEREISRLEKQIVKTPTIAPERARLEKCFSDLIEQRDFLKTAVTKSRRELDQHMQAVGSVKLLGEMPPLPPQLKVVRDLD